jgi:hypothetical protein
LSGKKVPGPESHAKEGMDNMIKIKALKKKFFKLPPKTKGNFRNGRT